MGEHIWFVVPAYNESQVLAETLSRLTSDDFEVVVVDDGSSDDTPRIARSAGCYVCRHPVNLGQGAALQTGLQFALLNEADIVVTFDSDGQHRVEDALEMISALRNSAVDVVLGSRFLGGTEGMSFLRYLLLKLATVYTRMHTGLRVTDTHNGLRVFSRHAASQIHLRHNRMAHASELLSQVSELKLKYIEYPCTIIYSSYSKRKGQSAAGAFRILLDLYLGRLYR